MRPSQLGYVSIALCRLRRGVNACCWVTAAALLAQLFVWGIATFTSVRFENVGDKSKAKLVITSGEARKSSPLSLSRKSNVEITSTSIDDSQTAVDPNRVLSKHDKIMSTASNLCKGAGTLSVFMILPLMAVAVLLGAGSVTPGIDKSVSAFIWSVVIALLVLPVGGVFGLPWQEGALVSYELMTSEVDRVMGGDEGGWGNATFYARYALLPLACIAGLAIVGLRFSSGVEAGIIQKETMRLDPKLEQEVANIKPSSLHGGRADSALRKATGITSDTDLEPTRSIKQVSPGEMPKRII